MSSKDRTIHDKDLLLHILTRSQICHLAFADAPTPYVVPMNFGFTWGDASLPCLFFHTTFKGRKITLLQENPQVGFSLYSDTALLPGERPCDCGMHYKSIIGSGIMHTLEDEQERRAALDALVEHYTPGREKHYDERIFRRTKLLCLTVQHMTGHHKQ